MPRVVPIQIDEKWPSLTGIRSWVMFFLTWSIDIALAKLGRASANQPCPYDDDECACINMKSLLIKNVMMKQSEF